jgi:hypothetical protein
MKDDEREYRDDRFVEIVAEPALKKRVYHHVSQMTGPGEPPSRRQTARPDGSTSASA